MGLPNIKQSFTTQHSKQLSIQLPRDCNNKVNIVHHNITVAPGFTTTQNNCITGPSTASDLMTSMAPLTSRDKIKPQDTL